MYQTLGNLHERYAGIVLFQEPFPIYVFVNIYPHPILLVHRVHIMVGSSQDF